MNATHSDHHFWVYLNVAHPVAAWATYVGRLESVTQLVGTEFRPISLWQARLIADAVARGESGRLRAEANLEEVRKREFPDEVSRLTGLFFFEDQATAEHAGTRWGGGGSFQAENLAEVGFSAVRVSRMDSEWISNCLGQPDEDWMRAYWRGDPYGEQPLWEILAEGAGLVWGTAIRKRAWERCLAEFPDSQVILDVARIANELGHFRIGLTVPWLHPSETSNKLRLDYLLDSRDENDPNLKAALENYIRGLLTRPSSHPPPYDSSELPAWSAA
jgi:hypothetical protein